VDGGDNETTEMKRLQGRNNRWRRRCGGGMTEEASSMGDQIKCVELYLFIP